MKNFAKKPAYKVLKQDRNAHIVQSLTDNTYSYVLFETPRALLPGELLQRADTSCLVMIHKESSDKMLLTVAKPDLADRVTKLSTKMENEWNAAFIPVHGLMTKVVRFR